MAPRVGPASPWINGSDVASSPRVARAITALQSGKANFPVPSQAEIDGLCAAAAAAASDSLYALSGRIFTGLAGPVTVRPIARPSDIDTRTWLGAGGWGWTAGWGSASYYGLGTPRAASHFGITYLPEVELGDYPINQILQVKIDGVVIPPDEYELRDYRTLGRIRTSASSVPTERWGWPTAQVADLPDTEPGTFSVTYTYGTDPGEGGRLAARKLAEYLVLPDLGDTTSLPRGTTSVQRQGITARVADVTAILASGQLGIYEVDAWLLAVNPKKQRKPSVVWTPDRGRARRTQNPTQTGAP